jgi:hypothetical protein
METRANYSAEERDRLEQELLELHFGCHEDPATLQARLQAEPALRTLQAEVLQKARALEQAVRPTQPALDLREPARTVPPSRWRLLRSSWGRIAAAGILAGVTLLGAFVAKQAAQGRLTDFQAQHVHLTLSAPRSIPVGAPWSFTVQANDLRGTPADCRVRWQAFGGSDAVLAAGEDALRGGTATVAMAALPQTPQRIEVVATHGGDEVRQVLPLTVAPAGPLVHVTTDRPVYRPGEVLFARAVTLDRITLLPTPTSAALRAVLFDAKGAQVAVAGDNARAGAAGFSFVVPEGSAGGAYRVEVASLGGEFAPESLEVIVRPFQNPQLQKTIVLDRASYAPGARGSAAVRADRLGGGPAAGASARGALVLDGNEVWHEVQPLGSGGDAVFRFTVPNDVKEGAARFVATITDGGVVETEVRPFVVPTGRVLVAGFPEGGELIAGVENRVYLECTDPLGRFVDSAGAIVDDRGATLAKFSTTHQGRTRVQFTPRAGRSYSVQLAGNHAPQPLPAVAPTGLALQLQGDEVAAGQPLRLQVAGRGDGPWLLGVFCRGALVGQTALRTTGNDELSIIAEVPLPASAAGVLRATVFDRRMQPVAERLLRRASAHRVQVDLLCERAALTPGELQNVTVRTTDETGRPVPAVVGLSVTDLAVASLGSEPRIGLQDHAALFADVERTENLGDFLLGHPAGAQHADLLLGTRGWRRFVWRNDVPAKAAIDAHGPFAAHLMAREGFTQPPQAVSNHEAAHAAAGPLHSAVWAAERRLDEWLKYALVALIVLTLLEGLIAGQRAARRGSPLPLLAGAGLLLVVAFTVLSTHTLGLGDAAPMLRLQAELQDFDALPAAAPVPVMVVEDLVEARAVFEEERKQHVFLFAAVADPAANPLAGAFFNDGGDGDIRARGENVFRVLPGPDLKLEGAFEARDDLRLVGQPLRQYAHQHTPHEGRRDFAPTIFWNPLLTTDGTGQTKVSFATSDAVTTWLVQADAHVASGADGHVGQAEAKFTARLPFHLECKLPDEISAGDELLLPIAAVVEGAPLSAVDLRVQLGSGLRLVGGNPQRIDLQDGRGRTLLGVAATAESGATTVTIEGSAGRFTDRVQRTLRIAPRGFPHMRSTGGTVSTAQPATLSLAVPTDAVPGSGRITLKLFPSPLSALTEGLQGILQEPHGCFEQASSSNYPNTLVLTLLEASGDDVPAVAARARDLLPRGYAKITGYECKERGYEWFGGDPGHEALTAYGLLQFHDMAKVHPVDAGMVERTRNWLLSRRDGKGGYQRNPRALDHFGGAPQQITDAYVTYALLQAGVPAAELAKELDALQARAATNDPYELAVIVCALHLAQRTEPAAAARARLASMQQEDGSLRGTTSSITSSGGQDLIVETTGFAVLAWLPDPASQGALRRAVQFLQSARSSNGTFGATQATIQALRALTAYAQQNRAMKAPGTLRVFEGERLLAERSYPAGHVDALALDLWQELAPGAHTLRLELVGEGELPWACDVAYHSEQPADDPDGKLSVRTALRSSNVAEGETVALDVEVENRTADGLPMAIAIVGLPAGLELPTRVLEDLQKAQKFAFWELRGRELALYWRDLEPEGKRTLSLDLLARVPGRSAGPASRVCLYYTPQAKRWAAPLVVEVTGR